MKRPTLSKQAAPPHFTLIVRGRAGGGYTATLDPHSDKSGIHNMQLNGVEYGQLLEWMGEELERVRDSISRKENS